MDCRVLDHPFSFDAALHPSVDLPIFLMKPIHLPTLVLAACAAASACRAQEPGFTVTLTGGVDARFSGRAISCTSDAPGEARTMVVLQQGERHLLVLVPSADPAPGEYPVAADPTRATVMYGSDWQAGPGTYVGERGTVRITSATANRLAGTANVDARELRDRTEARITATFTAERTGRMVRGSCGEQQGDTAPAALAAPPPPGAFKGELGSREASTPLAGEAAFCVHRVGGTETMSLRMIDRSGGVAWVMGLPPRAGSTPVSPRGAMVWLEPNDTAGTKMRLNGGYVVIDRFSAEGVAGSVRAAHSPEPGSEEGWWHFSAALNAIPGNCRN